MSALWLWLAMLTARAESGSEIVLLLDNSCSMAVPSEGPQGVQFPPNDPGRVAVLGALVVEGLARGSADQVTVLGFGDSANAAPQEARSASAIRGMRYTNGTWFMTALEEARRKLDASSRSQQLFMFFSDGSPSDVDDPQELSRTLKLSEDPDLDTFIVGLYASPQIRQHAGHFLQPLARGQDALVELDATRASVAVDIIRSFTRAYARALGSRPLVGTLRPRGSLDIEVPRYVTEVMVVTASTVPGPAYTAKLQGPAGPVAVQAQGDNGCGGATQVPPGLCTPPRRHYQVFRSANEPQRESTWTLSLPDASGEIVYGVILRYDLVASLAVPSPARTGEPIELTASLLFQGDIFNDATFFESDAFEVVADVQGTQVTLAHAGDGVFTGTWLPEGPTGDSPALAEVAFRNSWMEKSDRRPIVVEGLLELTLRVAPNPLELGSWRGEREATRRCGILDLSGSINADRVPVVCEVEGAWADARATCQPVPGSEATLGSRAGQPMQWEVCVEAAGCCGALPGPGEPGAVARLAGKHPDYASGAARVPMSFTVEPAGFWRCWWLEIALAVGGLFTGWFILGWIRPHNFEPDAGLRIAGSEAGLRRTSELVLCELPGGRRGFYRSARVCLDGDGNPILKPRKSVFVVQADTGGSTRFVHAQGLEYKNRRRNRWEPVPEEELAEGYQPGMIYRVGGNLYLKFS